MLINATVNIDMIGGIIPNGDSGSALITINPVAAIYPKAQVLVGSQQGLGMGMSLNPNANVIHRASVDINAPDDTR
jgi:hypothetical protein